MLSDKLNSILNAIATKLEHLWNKAYSINKNHMNFRVCLTIVRGTSRLVEN